MTRSIVAFLREIFRSDGQFKYGMLLPDGVYFLSIAVSPSRRSLVALVKGESPTDYELNSGITTVVGSVSHPRGMP